MASMRNKHKSQLSSLKGGEKATKVLDENIFMVYFIVNELDNSVKSKCLTRTAIVSFLRGWKRQG